MGLFALEQDPKKAVDGVPVALEHYDCRITIARAGGHNADQYEKALSEVTEPFRRAIAHKLLDGETDRRLTYETYARAVVKRWETRWESLSAELQEKLLSEGVDPSSGYVDGIDWRGDELLPVTAENVVKVFEALPDLFLDVRELSKDLKVFAVEKLEAAAKN